MMKLPSFSGKTVLVTGASSGIGRETALAFARAGAQVVMVARRAEALTEVEAQARKRHDARTLVVPADVTRPAQVRACFRQAVAAFGGVDVVVNNAGILIPSRVEDIRGADLKAMLDVNLFGALYVMQQAAAVMRKQGRGNIVNVASLGGRRAFSPIGGYSATKFALIGLTEAFRMELAGTDIHASLVLPGVIETPMVERTAASDDELGALWPKALNMPADWVVAAIFAAVRFNLRELSVPPGAGEISKLLAVAPGIGDSLIRMMTGAARAASKLKRSAR